MTVLDKPEVRNLLVAARATRDYSMLTGKNREVTDELIEALSPFDADPEQISSEHLVNLRKCMRDACRGIDEYTLTQILAGEPPVWIGPGPAKPQRIESGDQKLTYWFRVMMFRARTLWPKAWQRFLLPGFAVGLLILAMHYTQWSFKANLTITQIDHHITTDVHEEVRDLIVVARAIQANDTSNDNADTSTPARRLFSQTMSKLRSYHHHEGTLNIELLEALERFDPIAAAKLFVADLFSNFRREPDDKSAEPQGDEDNNPQDNSEKLAELTSQDGVGDLLEQPVNNTTDIAATIEELEQEAVALGNEIASKIIPASNASGNPTPTEDLSPTQLNALVIGAITEHKGFKEIVNIVAEETGRDTSNGVTDHVLSRLELLKQVKRLQDRISVVNRFALPMIYGSLGAALFCLVRVLTPALSDLGPARAFLRVLFGAFSAMTLSMLFIPANVFSINAQSNPTVIFLACFLFGYSFDAVLASLHRLEAWLHGRVKTTEGNT